MASLRGQGLALGPAQTCLIAPRRSGESSGRRAARGESAGEWCFLPGVYFPGAFAPFTGGLTSRRSPPETSARPPAGRGNPAPMAEPPPAGYNAFTIVARGVRGA